MAFSCLIQDIHEILQQTSFIDMLLNRFINEDEKMLCKLEHLKKNVL